MQAEPFEQAEIDGAAPPQIGQRDVVLSKRETRVPDHVEIPVCALLHMHRMAEQQTDHPRPDVGFGGFGEQQHAARLEDTMELGKGALLLDEVMESLMAEHDIDTCAGQRELRAVAMEHFDAA